MTSSYDLVAIGGGAGGLSAVRTARWAGKSAALITDGEPGGDCTFTGCVPSKALIAKARQGASFADAIAHINTSISTIAANEDMATLRHEGIDVYDGRGRLAGANSIVVGADTLTADKIVLATGASAFVPPIPGLSDVDYLTNEDVFTQSDAPESLGVLGGGAIGCEMAQAFARLGVNVVLFEALDRVLAREEPEASAVVAAALTAAGVDVRVGQRVEEVRATNDNGGCELTTADGATVAVARLLVAVGRTAHTDGLGLDVAGVAMGERGTIATDDRLRTNIDNIYAVGDVTGKLPFTHAADEMGRLAVGNAFRKGLRGKFSSTWIPWTTFTDPEVAHIGMTEAEAASAGGRVAYLPFDELDRAITEERTEGFIKLIAGPKRITRRAFGGEVIGATIVGPRAGEMINEIALAMRTRMFTGRLGQTVHSYPTWGMAIPQAAGQFFFEVGGRTARPAKA